MPKFSWNVSFRHEGQSFGSNIEQPFYVEVIGGQKCAIVDCQEVPLWNVIGLFVFYNFVVVVFMMLGPLQNFSQNTIAIALICHHLCQS